MCAKLCCNSIATMQQRLTVILGIYKLTNDIELCNVGSSKWERMIEKAEQSCTVQ